MIDLSSLSTMHWLLISNCALLVMVVLGFMVVRHQYQKELKSWQHKTQKSRTTMTRFHAVLSVWDAG